MFLNGKSLGKDKPGTIWNEMQCEWMVPYEEGKLEAVAYKDGVEIKRTHFNTSKQPSKLKTSLKKAFFRRKTCTNGYSSLQL